jgi:2,4-dienoyl-CoA reductase-like NADH-dependent reductase (Old Yellow Enzyme family)
LVDTFINTSSNTRTDEYGGSIENRARFPLELLDALVEAIGANKVALRFSPWSGFQDMEDDTPVETWSYLTQQIQTNHSDLAYLHFVESREGGHSDEELLEHESLDPFRNIWQGPFITSGGFTDPKKAIERCEISPNNLISFGRLFIANPDLVDRIRNDWPLNKYHRPTFYTQGLDGYIDYPFYTPTTSTDGDNDDDIVPVAKVTDGLAVAESAATDDATADAAVTESNSETVQQPDTKADKRKSKKSSTAKCIIQ